MRRHAQARRCSGALTSVRSVTLFTLLHLFSGSPNRCRLIFSSYVSRLQPNIMPESKFDKLIARLDGGARGDGITWDCELGGGLVLPRLPPAAAQLESEDDDPVGSGAAGWR